MVRARCIVQCTFAHPWWRTIKPETKNNTWTRTGYNTRTSRSAQQTSAGVRKRHIQRRREKNRKNTSRKPHVKWYENKNQKKRSYKRNEERERARKNHELWHGCKKNALHSEYERIYHFKNYVFRLRLRLCLCVCVWVSAFFCMLVFQLNFSLLTLFICDILCKIICLFIRLLSASIAIFSHW